jgi:hypothetical protein
VTTPPQPPEWSIHPDLLEEELAARAQDETPSPPPEPRRRSRGRAANSTTTDAEAASTQPDASAPQPEPPADGEATDAAASPPAWLSEVKGTDDPTMMLAVLAKNLPKDALEKDPTLQGWIGDVAQRRAKAIQDQQAKEAAEAAKLDAARRGDLYQLGQLTAPEMQARIAAENAQQQNQPLLQQVVDFQKTLPVEVQAEIQGKTYDSFSAYIQATVDAAARHGRETYFDQTLKEREPALRKAWLSEANGDQQVPELEGGRASSVREITDEQLARMTLAETDAVLDEFGQPRPGIRLRLTRGIPLTRR